MAIPTERIDSSEVILNLALLVEVRDSDPGIDRESAEQPLEAPVS
jgi:hypothetical protein